MDLRNRIIVPAEFEAPSYDFMGTQARSPDKPFKPVPSGFEIASFRQSRPPLSM